MVFYQPTFSVFVTLGYLNHSQGFPKIFGTSKVELLKEIRRKKNSKKTKEIIMQKMHKIK